mgnify:FL=1
MSNSAHANLGASAWVQRWTSLIPRGGKVLDLACGHGRHMQWLRSQGFDCLGVDRDAQALEHAQAHGDVLQADLENAPWPLQGQTFAAVVITHYLWRPLWPHVLASLALGGVLIHETFSQGNETVGKPSNPAFLWRHGELLDHCQSLHIVAFENGFLSQPDRFIQRIAAVRLDADTLPRFAL